MIIIRLWMWAVVKSYLLVCSREDFCWTRMIASWCCHDWKKEIYLWCPSVPTLLHTHTPTETLLYVASFAFLSPALSDHSSCDNQGTWGCFYYWDSKAMNEDLWIYTWMLLLPLPRRLRFCLCNFYCDIGPFLVRYELQCVVRMNVFCLFCLFVCLFVFAKMERILMKCASGLKIMHRNTWIEIIAWSSSYLTSWFHSTIITVNESQSSGDFCIEKKINKCIRWICMKSLWVFCWRPSGRESIN